MNPLYFILIIGFLGCRNTKNQSVDTSIIQEEDVDFDGDGYFASEDCDDNNNLINPNAEELCDSIDNNCDGEIDEGVTTTFYNDVDEDGYGDPDTSFDACSAENGAVTNGMDCDDSNALIWPGAEEECDGIDNNCDGEIDEDLIQTWFQDADGDGFGEPQTERETCAPEENEVLDGTDCDDTDSSQYPQADELCNGEDDNCDGVVDEDTATDAQTWYEDTDIDSFGDPESSIISCSQPMGYILDNTDCDDSDTEQYPGADEKCNFEDDNCDGVIDENTAVDAPTWYQDLDNDTFGNLNSSQNSCSQPGGYVLNSTDCDDTDSTQNPNADEVCNGEDDNCDTVVDENTAVDAQTWYQDLDSDTYGDAAVSQNSCTQPSGHVLSSADCDDGDATQNPNADEVCNGEDDNCDTVVDESTAVDAQAWFLDSDNDTFGDAAVSQNSCTQPGGHVLNSTDCDDTDSAQNPDADEVCNGEDDNCDTVVDEDTALDALLWYEDSDNDTFGDSDSTTYSCEQPTNFVGNQDDCNDQDSSINPNGTEICNGEDDDCDGIFDTGALGEDEICVAFSCAAILTADSSAPDGTYWIRESSTTVQAYCDMELGTALCSEIEQDRTGVTRDPSALPYKMRAVLEPSQERCAIWAVRHATTNTPFGSLYTPSSSISTCQALGFITDSSLNSCSYGASYGNCGYTSDLYYRYGNACGGCSLNDGYHNRYLRQGYMSSASVMSTMSGSVRSYCTTE